MFKHIKISFCRLVIMDLDVEQETNEALSDDDIIPETPR